jgi:3-oxoacyl-[acyl-carrier-protein] synthase II
VNINTSFITHALARASGIKGPFRCNTMACSTGTAAVGISYRMIQRGEAKVMITGSADVLVDPFSATFSYQIGINARG